MNFNEERRKFLVMSGAASLMSLVGLSSNAEEIGHKIEGSDKSLIGIKKWVRFSSKGKQHFGYIDGDEIIIYGGEMFGRKYSTGDRVNVSKVKFETPCQPSKIPALWNNFYKRAEVEGNAIPPFPLFFYKPTSALLAPNQEIKQPVNYTGPVVFEAELGIVIGKTCKNIDEADVDDYIFGFTCLNDVTAKTILRADSSFVQWDRSKGFDTFCPIGPYIVSGIEPNDLIVRAVLNGVEKQNYPVSDMIFKPRQLVSKISQDTTLYPGDIIACGTSLGAAPMPSNSKIDVVIDGIGTLSNHFS